MGGDGRRLIALERVSIRRLLALLLAVVVVLAALLSIVTVLQVRTANQRSRAERQRVTSFRLSDSMRQSSNDLTRMVRLYVTTGQARYKRYYNEILDIRSGHAPRPLDYDSSFWDRVLADGQQHVRLGPPAALTTLMRRAHFSDDEFRALAASLAASNHLAELEVRTMAQIDRRVARGVDRRYLLDVAPQYDLMVDDEYHGEKRKIMAAIDRFTALVDARTARRAAALQSRTNLLLVLQTAVLLLLAAVLLTTLVVAARGIVQPLSSLADVTRRITRGDWSQRPRARGVRELAQLAGDFSAMADAVERDLAARRRAELEALDAERRLQTIADRVPGAVFHFHVDRDGAFSVRFASRDGNIHRSDGQAGADFAGVARAVLPEDRGAWLDSMLAAARTGGAWQLEYRIVAEDGDVAWMRGQALAVRNADGSAEMYGFVADVTERKALEADLRRAREDAEAADRAKSAFLAMMSHELRTPLVAVSGTLEILAMDDLHARQRELVDVATGSARSLLAVIGDVLDFSKIEAGFLDLAPATVAVGPLVQEVAAQYRHVAQGRGLALTADVDGRLAAAHVVDPARLRQVLGNLLSNAMKFTREGGVTLRAVVLEDTGDAQRVVFEVRDTGIGISEADQRRLFVPFTQASTDNARASDGTGLGLAICRQLVEAMGGHVTLRSRLGSGTAVRVELLLPVGAAEDVPHTGSGEAGTIGRRALPADHAAARAEGSLLLLVEDHPVNRLVLAGQLEAVGFRVDTAADADAALALFAEGEYGLVFTDIQLPHVDGYELARRLRALEADLGRDRAPLLALTASALQGELDRCRAAGMDGVVTKPTTMGILAATLRRHLPHVPWTALDVPARAPGDGADTSDDPLAELTAGDHALGERILARFVATVPDDVAAVAAALDAGDRDGVRRGAHRIVGAAGSVGARDVAGRARAIEHAVNDDVDAAQLLVLLDALRDAVIGLAVGVATASA